MQVNNEKSNVFYKNSLRILYLVEYFLENALELKNVAELLSRVFISAIESVYSLALIHSLR